MADDDASDRFELTVRSAAVGRQRAIRRLWRRIYWVASALSLGVVGVSTTAGQTIFGLGLMAMFLLKAVEAWEGSARDRAIVASHRRGVLTLHHPHGDEALTAASVREGHLRVESGALVLRVETREGARHDIVVSDRATAERWMAELAIDPARRRARIVTDRTAVQWVFAYFFGGVFAAPGLAVLGALVGLLESRTLGSVMWAFLLPGYWLAARSVGRVDVTVGVDGVYAGRGWWRRFFPLAAIAQVAVRATEPSTLRLVLRSGATHEYRFATESDAEAARARVEGVLALRGALPAAVERVLSAGLPAGAEKNAEAWRDVFVEALRGGSYREAPVTEDELAQVVSAPGVTGAQRVGAALALRAAAGPAGEVSGVRVAVEALTAPQTLAAIAGAERVVARRAG